jgi:hypothetical protein
VPLDPLSDVLSLLKPHTYVASGFDLSGEWSIQFDAHRGIKCWALVSGACWLVVEEGGEPVRLTAGDCILLPNGRRFRLATDLAVGPVPFWDLASVEWRDGIATLGGGGGTMILGGHFAFTGLHGEMLLGAMPPLVHLRQDSDKAALHWVLERMRQELTEPQPGGALVAQHLAQMMLVQALRLFLADGRGRSVGWLFALANPRMASAIVAVHAAPGARWTLPALAERGHVALKIRRYVQGDGRHLADRLPDAVAHASGGRSPGQGHGTGFGDCPVVGL